ncbi:hypothetical protein CerSpe_100550 [Prunus speciosa]
MLEPLAIAQSRSGLSSSSLLCCLHRCRVHNSKLITSCGQAGIDCRAIQPGGNCFRPDNAVSHASVAMNLFYKAATLMALA